MILPLTERDFALITSAKDMGYLDEWNKDMLLSALKNQNFYGLKVISDKNSEEVLGYIHYSLSVDSMDINSVFVFPRFRRKGVAEKLLSAAINTAKEKNLDKIFLEVRETNAPAIKLYQKAGFNKVGTRKKYYFDGENAIVMTRENLL
jgi:ribosomal-protein-alanine N-acetyltransferase